jgi:hypothetical protein
MAMSAVKESPFLNNLICSSFDYLPAIRDLARENIVLPAVIEEAWPRRVFRAPAGRTAARPNGSMGSGHRNPLFA